MIKKQKPLVSVVMPVFNAQKYLNDSIESILHQTFPDFELIIVDDASTDYSWKIIQNYVSKDNRILALRNPKNLGVSTTCNKAIKKSRGKYIVRMDADDISFLNRIEKEFNFLVNNPGIIAVGSQCIVVDENNQIIGNKKFPTKSENLKEMIFWAIPMQQPSIMINTNLLPKIFKWYQPDFSSAEEVDLIFRLMEYGQIANLPDFLLYYRHLNSSLSHRNPKITFNLTLKSRIKALKMGFRPTLKAIIFNLCQLIAINLLPANIINELWCHLRGIKDIYPQYKLDSVSIKPEQ